MNKEDIRWKAAEYQHFPKGFAWYVLVVFVCLIVIGIALWQNNFFFAVFMLLAGSMVMFLGNKEPRDIEFKITSSGIEIGEDISYRYEELEGFNLIEHDHKLNELLIKRDVLVNPFVKMPVSSHLTSRAVEKLKDNIPKENYKEPIVDIFADLLGF